MNLLFNQIFLDHNTGHHPENRKRIEAFQVLPDIALSFDESPLSWIHDQSYIDYVKECCDTGARLDGDTITSPASYKVAVAAVNATLRAAQQGDFALVRPPGHHAFPRHGSGFCLFNNVAIASQYFVNIGKKVLIIDIDGHLGDGTSAIFYGSDQVMYWSMHQYPAFPGNGFIYELGKSLGAGYTINIPLPAGAADDIVKHVFAHFLPIALQFEPDVVAISAGFDSHQYDLLLGLKFSTAIYHWIGQELSKHFPTLFATLEGGYNVEILKDCIYNFVAGVNREPIPHPSEETMSGLRVWEEYEANAHALLSILRPYWSV